MDYLDQTIVGGITKKTSAMTVEEATAHLEHLDKWELLHHDSTGYHIVRLFDFNDTDKAREYINELKKIADEMHTVPDIRLTGTQVRVACHTPKIQGLHLNDFIMAAHADDLYERWDIITGERDKVTEASDQSFPASDPPGY